MPNPALELARQSASLGGRGACGDPVEVDGTVVTPVAGRALSRIFRAVKK